MAIAAGFGLGMLALIVGAEWLVDGSVRLAKRLRVSHTVIGLTVVAFGTSAPELAVTLQAAATGSHDISVGNVIGSNIQNLMLVLGLSAMFVSLKVAPRILRIDMPLLLALTAVMAVMAIDGRISRFEGLLLVSTLSAYTSLAIRHGRSNLEPTAATDADLVERETESEQLDPSPIAIHSQVLMVLKIIIGLYLLTKGGSMFVDAARSLATRFGMPELTIGVTVVAFGTSLPEIVTCVLAAIRGHRELAIGNVVGSNIFNILCVLGIASSSVADGLTLSPSAVTFDIPLMLAITVLSFAVCLTGHRIVRGEGLLLLLIFASYVGWLVVPTGSESSLKTPFAITGLGFTALLIGFQLHALSRQPSRLTLDR